MIRKMIKLKLLAILNFHNMKPGYSYFAMQKLNKNTEKKTLTFLNGVGITKAKLVSYFNSLD